MESMFNHVIQAMRRATEHREEANSDPEFCQMA
jgi:hypothetical protein